MELDQQMFEKHRDEALGLNPAEYLTPRFGLDVYITEGHELVRAAKARWEVGGGAEGAPGLRVAGPKYERARLERLEELLHGLHYAARFARYQVQPGASVADAVARARFLMSELDSALSFVLDDDVEEIADQKLARLKEAEAEAGESAAEVGHLLLSWVSFAREEQARLEELGDFSAAIFDEAEALGGVLTKAHAPQVDAESDAAAQERARWMAARRGLFTLAHREVQALRRVADYVYRNHRAQRQEFASKALRRLRRGGAAGSEGEG
jgi:hypothetical protein